MKNDQWEEIEDPTADPSNEGTSMARRGITVWLIAGSCLAGIITIIVLALLANFLIRRGPSLPAAQTTPPPSQTADQETPASGDERDRDPSGEALPTSVPGPNLEILVDGSTMTVVNISSGPVSLVDVSFRRVSESGSYTATFQAQEWRNMSRRSIENMPPGDCFQVRGSEGRQTKPANCDTIQAWLATANQDWYFWTPADGERYFAVLQDGTVIHICDIPANRCVFYLPRP